MPTKIDSVGGYQAGYDDGNTAGYSKGHTDGYNSGKTDGYNSGYSKGKTDGYNSGYSKGHTDGYAAGKVKPHRYYSGGVYYRGSPHTVTIADCDSGNTSTKLVVIAEFSCKNIGNDKAIRFANHVFTLQGSNDQSTWTNLYSDTRKRPQYSTVTHKGALFKMDANYRYFRVTFSSNDEETTEGTLDCWFYVYY